ncbi:nucleotide-sugar transporter domain-containing protein [Ditylenchus destructor]|uniref:Nucleotide-sugar transporter domain-containing protein n=1 Tax=Ditylenchus destructor TaxID=166010 RepID=A0AAD4NE43_9BILA|nr:nucleotide-sugar transporter domain-containing protein [Ditylenchus destructor]
MADGKKESGGVPITETRVKVIDDEEVENTKETGSTEQKSDFLIWLKYVSLVVLVLQNAGQVLLMRYATTRPQPQFIKTVAVLFNEVVKLIAALILFTIEEKSVKKTLIGLRQHFIYDICDTLKVGVPAFIYTIQNFLLYVAIEHLDAGTYMVTYQLKILTTALFTVIMLRRRLSVPQWVSLVILVAGVAIVQKSANERSKQLIANITQEVVASIATTPAPTMLSTTESSVRYQNPILGFVAVISACFLSGFAGIYFEKILKGSNVSLWLRNIQLASLSIPIGIVVIAIKDRHEVMNHGVMKGFDGVVWSVVLLQALGGLVVAVVIKYADNILKAFATSISIVVSCVASIFLFALYPQLLFVLGAALVIGAVVIYGIFPYKAKKPTLDSDEAVEPPAKEFEVEKLLDNK